MLYLLGRCPHSVSKEGINLQAREPRDHLLIALAVLALGRVPISPAFAAPNGPLTLPMAARLSSSTSARCCSASRNLWRSSSFSPSSALGAWAGFGRCVRWLEAPSLSSSVPFPPTLLPTPCPPPPCPPHPAPT